MTADDRRPVFQVKGCAAFRAHIDTVHDKAHAHLPLHKDIGYLDLHRDARRSGQVDDGTSIQRTDQCVGIAILDCHQKFRALGLRDAQRGALPVVKEQQQQGDEGRDAARHHDLSLNVG